MEKLETKFLDPVFFFNYVDSAAQEIFRVLYLASFSIFCVQQKLLKTKYRVGWSNGPLFCVVCQANNIRRF